MIKQVMTPEKAAKIQWSLQACAIMAKCLEYEVNHELDADFRNPNLNNFARRIQNDSKAILQALATGKLALNVQTNDDLDQFSAQIWRLIHLLSGLNIQLVSEFTDNLEIQLKEVGV